MQRPDYTRDEFVAAFIDDPEFLRLFENWKKADYPVKGVKPSFDKIDDSRPYTFDNIQVVTWTENNAKEGRLRKIGKSSFKRYTPVIQLSLDGKILDTFISICEAARQTQGHDGHISEVIRGMRETSGGYKWRGKVEALK